MQTLPEIDPSTATGKAKQIMDRVAERIGRVPALIRQMAHSPAAAEAYLQFNIALAQARLSRETRALITAAVAEANGCSYGHLIARGEAEGLALTAEDLDAARRAEAKDFRTEQALRFAQRIVRERGKVPPAEVAALRNAGFDNAEIVEIVASVALNMFRNYFSLVAGTVVESAASPA